jgi:hypothetical protein
MSNSSFHSLASYMPYTGITANDTTTVTKSTGDYITWSTPSDHITFSPSQKPANSFKPKRVIYNPPATIVFWEDGTKTVVKCSDGTEYDPYTGFCVAIAKKTLGSSSAIKKAAGLYKTRGQIKREQQETIRSFIDARLPGFGRFIGT